MFTYISSGLVTPRNHQAKVEAIYGGSAIENGSISLNQSVKCFPKKVLYTLIK